MKVIRDSALLARLSPKETVKEPIPEAIDHTDTINNLIEQVAQLTKVIEKPVEKRKLSAVIHRDDGGKMKSIEITEL